MSVEVLDGGFDDEAGIGRGDVGERRRVGQPVEPAVDPGVGRIGVEVEPAARRSSPVRMRARPRSMAAGIDIVDAHVVACLERELGDAGTHRPGTDDAHRADRVHDPGHVRPA